MTKTVTDVITTIDATIATSPTKTIQDVADDLRELKVEVATLPDGKYTSFLYGSTVQCAGPYPPIPPPTIFSTECIPYRPDFRRAGGREFGAAVDLIAARTKIDEQRQFLVQLKEYLQGLAAATTGTTPSGPGPT